jgi:Undecaprenyl-phosphate glucose phosphotransferase
MLHAVKSATIAEEIADVHAAPTVAGRNPVWRRRPQLRLAVPDEAAIAAIWLGDMAIAMAAARWTGMSDRTLAAAAIQLTFCGVLAGAYDPHRLDRLLPAVNAWISAALLLLVLAPGTGDPLAAIDRTGTLWLAAAPCGLALRAVLFRTVTMAHASGRIGRRCALVGCPRHADELIAAMRRSGVTSAVALFADEDGSGGDIGTLVSEVRAGRIDEVVVTLGVDQSARIEAIVAALASSSVEIVLAPDRYLLKRPPHALRARGGIPLLSLQQRPLPAGDRFIKAVADRAVATALLLAMLPLMLAIAIAIRLDSEGPPLFRQSREGINGRPFDIYKFRTLTVVDDRELTQVRRGDRRVTRLGRLLRASSMDELPQLLNVLLGDMSLVGPRPHAPATRAGGRTFHEVASAYPMRHRIKPGLTGWAQVHGFRGETRTEDALLRRLDHDLHYIANWSLALDLKVLAMTVAAVLFPRNAY